MNTKLMTLYFSGSVNASFSPTGISFQNALNSSASPTYLSYSLTTKHKFVVRNSLGTTFTGLVGDYDINYMKSIGLGNASSSTYLTMVYAQTTSTFAGTIVPYLKSTAITSDKALLVRFYAADTQAPSLLYFDLNLNDPAYVVLSFDEPVKPLSLSLAGLVLLSRALGNFAVIQSGTVFSQNLTNLVINITSSSVLDKIKISYTEGALNGIMLSAGGVLDMAGNPFPGNYEFSAVSIRQFTADTTAPYILGVTLALGLGYLTIDFSEVINFGTCKPFLVTFMSNVTVNSSLFSYELTNYSVILQPTVSSITVDMNLYSYDNIHLDFGLYTVMNYGVDTNSSFLTMTGVRDLFGNEIVNVAVAVTTLPDRVAPVLWSFSMQVTSLAYDFQLYFSEVVNITSFNCSDFVFVSAANSSGAEVIRLTSESCHKVSLVDNMITFASNVSDVTAATNVFHSSATTFIAYPTSKDLIDYAGNKLVNIPLSSAKQQGTAVVKYMVDLAKGQVTLVFSAPVMRAGFVNISRFGFYSATSGYSFFFNSSSIVKSLFVDSPDNDTVAVLKFSTSDFVDFKYIDVKQSTLYLIVLDEAIRDISNVWLLPISKNNHFIPIAFVPDTIKPVLGAMTLDMSNDLLTMVFDEPIRSSSITISNFRLQSNKTSLSNSVKLSGGTIVVSKNIVNFYFSRVDMINIKLHSAIGLGTSNLTSYLSFTFNSLSDYAGNAARAVPFNNAVQIATCIVDTKAPKLLSYGLDFTALVITFYFSEPVIASEVNITQVTIQNSFYSGNGVAYTFTGGNVISQNSDIIQVQMLLSDVNNIKLLASLARNRQLSYFVTTSDLCTDMFGNAVVAISDGAAQAATLFTADTIPPVVVAYTYNANEYYILFNMSEPVPLYTVDATALTIALFPGSHVNYTLTQFSLPDDIDGIAFNIVLNLYAQDMNSLNARDPLASSVNTTWASFTSLFVKDTFGNGVKSVNPLSSMKPEKYVVDVTRPRIVAYELDMNLMRVVLTFSESISTATLNTEQVLLQNCAVRRFCAVVDLNSSQADFTIEDAVAFMTISVPFDTELYLKYYGVGLTKETSLISWTDVFAADFAGNYISPLWDGSVLGFSPREPDILIPDTTAPILVEWFIDRQHWNIHLRFSEPVAVRNLTKLVVTALAGHTSHRLTLLNDSISIQYINFNSEMNLTFSDVCLTEDSCTASPQRQFLKTYSTAVMFLFMDTGAVYDMALVPNPSASIPVKQEGSPGRFSIFCQSCSIFSLHNIV
jgi:hypothetical protein